VIAMQSVVYPLTIYYDHSCPLCRGEVDLLREHNGEGNLSFVDCSPNDFSGNEGYSREAMMKLIHARDVNGQWLIGPPVFSAAYRAVGIESIAALWSTSWLQPVWNRLYPWVANNRMWLSKIGVFTVAMWAFKKIATRSANARAKRVVAESCSVNDRKCSVSSATQTND
jgi:predicted DCC family thiol-disulfide oxidoreductase YuxK